MQQMVIAGVSGGIGRALAENALEGGRWRVLGLCRKPDDQTEWAEAWGDRLEFLPWDALEDSARLDQTIAGHIQEGFSVDGLIYAAGVLHGEGLAPEKRLEDLDEASLARVFQINASAFPLLVRSLMPWMRHRHLKRIMAISAKVGSISDNGFGGWYAYRASKAALNMLVRNLSIELPRRIRPVTCAAVHPGTTLTALSEPFQQSLAQLEVHKPEATADNLMRIFEQLDTADNGSFLNWDGSALPW